MSWLALGVPVDISAVVYESWQKHISTTNYSSQNKHEVNEPYGFYVFLLSERHVYNSVLIPQVTDDSFIPCLYLMNVHEDLNPRILTNELRLLTHRISEPKLPKLCG